jgi:ATP synthase F1 complex assembly factor 2
LREKKQHSANSHTSIAGRSRFYKGVGILPADDDNYKITLDGRVLKTPARNPLYLPTFELAFGIAAEWDAQTDKRKGIQPVTMPLMTLASTAIDQVSVEPEITISNCMKYLPTDSALYHTDETDRILLGKQRQHLMPVVRWTEKVFGVNLQINNSMANKIKHPEEVSAKLENVLKQMDPFTLTCLQAATYECKSLVLGLAFVSRQISTEQVITASRLEEEFQLEVWGVVEGGHDMDRLNNATSLSSVGYFMHSLYDGDRIKEHLTLWRI